MNWLQKLQKNLLRYARKRRSSKKIPPPKTYAPPVRRPIDGFEAKPKVVFMAIIRQSLVQAIQPALSPIQVATAILVVKFTGAMKVRAAH